MLKATTPGPMRKDQAEHTATRPPCAWYVKEGNSSPAHDPGQHTRFVQCTFATSEPCLSVTGTILLAITTTQTSPTVKPTTLTAAIDSHRVWCWSVLLRVLLWVHLLLWVWLLHLLLWVLLWVLLHLLLIWQTTSQWGRQGGNRWAGDESQA